MKIGVWTLEFSSVLEKQKDKAFTCKKKKCNAVQYATHEYLHTCKIIPSDL